METLKEQLHEERTRRFKTYHATQWGYTFRDRHWWRFAIATAAIPPLIVVTVPGFIVATVVLQVPTIPARALWTFRDEHKYRNAGNMLTLFDATEGNLYDSVAKDFETEVYKATRKYPTTKIKEAFHKACEPCDVSSDAKKVFEEMLKHLK